MLRKRMRVIMPLIASFFIIGFVFFVPVFAEESVRVVTLPPASMAHALENGLIDGFIVWEPFCADSVERDIGVYFVKSSDVWDSHPCCVLSTISQKKQISEALLWVHMKAVDYLNNPVNHKQLREYARDFTGKSRRVIDAALKNISFITYPDQRELRRYFDELNTKHFFTRTVSNVEQDIFLDSLLSEDSFSAASKKYANGWTTDRVDETIRFGYLTADLHQLAYYVAEKEGFFSEAFADIQVQQFKNGPAVMNAYKAGLLDAAYLGGAPAVLKSFNESIPIQIIAGANNNGSALIVSEEVLEANSISGRKIATPGFGTVQDLVLRMYAVEHGLTIRVE